MTTIPKPNDLANGFNATYDAWNRLVKIVDAKDDNTIVVYEYDSLNRRIVKNHYTGGKSTSSVHFYYNGAWQCLEERKEVGGVENVNPLAQNAWHPYYIDAMATHWYDADTDGNLAENNDGQNYFLHDANFNITGVLNSSGTVIERYAYSPYGKVTFLNANFTEKTSQASAIGNDYLFTGRRLDQETGIYYFRGRYFGWHVGRFLNRDPIGYADGGNLYAGYFVPGGVDPSGFCNSTWNKECPELMKLLSTLIVSHTKAIGELGPILKVATRERIHLKWYRKIWERRNGSNIDKTAWGDAARILGLNSFVVGFTSGAAMAVDDKLYNRLSHPVIRANGRIATQSASFKATALANQKAINRLARAGIWALPVSVGANGFGMLNEIKSTAGMLDSIGTLEVDISRVHSSLKNDFELLFANGHEYTKIHAIYDGRPWNAEIDGILCKILRDHFQEHKSQHMLWLGQRKQHWTFYKNFFSGKQYKAGMKNLKARTDAIISN